MLSFFRRRRPRPFAFPAGTTIEKALAEIKRMIMNPSTDAAAIITKINALPGLINTVVTNEVTAAEAAKDAQRATDIAAISAAVDAVTAGVTPAPAPQPGT